MLTDDLIHKYNWTNSIISGGPVVVEESHAFEDFPRFVLLGTVHGSFDECSNDLAGIFVATDELSTLQFLYKEAYGSGLLLMIYFIWIISLRCHIG